MTRALRILLLLLPAVAHADDWSVRCDREGVCRLRTSEGRVWLRGDADRQRGSLRCAEDGEWLACTWQHTTQLHLNEGYFVHLPTHRTWRMRLDSLAMTETGEFGRILSRPRWEGAGVRLIVEMNDRRFWIWRRRPAGSRMER